MCDVPVTERLARTPRASRRAALPSGILFVFCVLLASAPSRAGVIVATDHTTGNPLMIDAGDNPSTGTMTVSISSDVMDVLLGWQLELNIVPLGGSTGTVEFSSAAAAGVNYVFGVPQLFNSNIIGPANTSMTAFDASFPVMPVAIPGPPGLNLLDLDFSASLDASGTFGVFVIGGLGHSEWTDSAINATLYANIGGLGPGQSDQIGEIFVQSAAPEPGTLVLMSVGLVGLFGFGRRARRD